MVFTIDAHAAGEPCRVIVAGGPGLAGATIAERRRLLKEEYDHIRTALTHEPRGHGDMFGAILIAPERAGSAFGLIFFDAGGYLDGCGHGTLCSVAVWRRLHGPLTPPFVIDNPDGSVTRVVAVEGGETGCESTLEMPPAHVVDPCIRLNDLGGAVAGVAHCGNTYVIVAADEVGITDLNSVGPEQIRRAGLAVRDAACEELGDAVPARVEVALFQPRKASDDPVFSTAILFSERQIDRSPCGTGSSALYALLCERDRFKPGTVMYTVGPAGEKFRLIGHGEAGPEPASPRVWRVRLSGEAFVTGIHEWIMDADDALRDGFLLEQME